MLESDRGPLVLEVNSSPGLEGIEGATKVNVAGKVAEHLHDLDSSHSEISEEHSFSVGSSENESERAL